MSHQRLTTFPEDPILDLEPWVGQRQCGFRFELSNGVTGERLGTIKPLRTATLSHDTSRTIKRQLTLDLGVVDTASVDTQTARVEVFMTFLGGTEYPLGKYMFTDASRQQFTSGHLGNMTLSDEMFLIDQQIEAGVDGTGRSVMAIVQTLLLDLPVNLIMESSPFNSTENWGIGAYRGQILESVAVSGDYFSPWFGNDAKLHFIRTFNPITRLPDFDWDTGSKVIRSGIIETDDLLTAPNRFIVVSNSSEDPEVEVVGTADVPSTAPHSIANRGFVIPEVQNLQLSNVAQAQAVAEGIAQRATVFEQVSLTTPLDPRHDSYNTIRWDGELWLELAWSMQLAEDGVMSHLLRKAYAP